MVVVGERLIINDACLFVRRYRLGGFILSFFLSSLSPGAYGIGMFIYDFFPPPYAKGGFVGRSIVLSVLCFLRYFPLGFLLGYIDGGVANR